jgi:PPOX class probable F420-dependent enzyme
MNGQPMPSPVWFGIGNGKLYFETGADSFKVKRIRRNPDVVIAPATVRGRPVGPPFRGKARVVEPDEHAEAERIVQSNYGAGRRLYTVMGSQFSNCYVEVTPA